MRRILCLCLSMFCWVSCEREAEPEGPLVVEGWIENGRPPVVMLHQAIGLNEDWDSLEAAISAKLIVWGKVSLSSLDTTVVLTGQIDGNYLMHYRYSTPEMFGQSGREYDIEVEARGRKVRAHTGVPSVVPLDSVVVKVDKEPYVNVTAYWTDPAADNDYYALFYRHRGQVEYVACGFGTLSDESAENGVLSAIVYKNPGSLIDTKSDMMWFRRDDTVTLKLAHIDEVGYRFWQSFQNSVSSRIPVFNNSPSNGLKSNIDGGFGYWCGMGVSEHRLHLEKDTTLYFVR